MKEKREKERKGERERASEGRGWLILRVHDKPR
jgi:hypothetical protein